MDVLGMLMLSIIQGITEWLPVSSSAHLALAQLIFFGKTPILYDLALHLGTTLAVLVYFREKIIKMIMSVLKLETKTEEFNLAVLVVIASIPTAIIGFALKKFFESMYSNPFYIGIALIITSLILFSTAFAKSRSEKSNPKNAILMGIAQGIAVAPGISRSGATISTGLHSGMSWKDAAFFSFLIAVPAVLGASFFQAIETPAAAIDPTLMIVGILGAFVTGYATIHILLNWISEKTFPLFGVYCLLLGLLILYLVPIPA